MHGEMCEILFLLISNNMYKKIKTQEQTTIHHHVDRNTRLYSTKLFDAYYKFLFIITFFL